MESRDIGLCKEMASLLFNEAPEGSCKIILRADLNVSGDVCKFECDHVNGDGQISWFAPESGAFSHEIGELLLQHRDFFVSQGQPAWVSCEFIVDVEKGKFFMNLKHD